MTDVILVDENDREVGTAEKIKAHSNGGIRHRAFSIFVFNGKGELMMQQRTNGKYHSKGQWTDTCSSHPLPGEDTETAAHRRLREEMGFDCELREVFYFKYQTPAGSGLSENEYDHVFFGRYEDDPVPNKKEVSDWKWITMDALKRQIERNPENFAPWLKLMLSELMDHYQKYDGFS
jgi:isopentenyl-diphosphate Delta-isomerase